MALTLLLLPSGAFRLGCPGLCKDVAPEDLVATCTRILQAQRDAPQGQGLAELVATRVAAGEVSHYTPTGRQIHPDVTLDDILGPTASAPTAS